MRIFYCRLCNESFTRKGFRKHLREYHRITNNLTESNLWMFYNEEETKKSNIRK